MLLGQLQSITNRKVVVATIYILGTLAILLYMSETIIFTNQTKVNVLSKEDLEMIRAVLLQSNTLNEKDAGIIKEIVMKTNESQIAMKNVIEILKATQAELEKLSAVLDTANTSSPIIKLGEVVDYLTTQIKYIPVKGSNLQAVHVDSQVESQEKKPTDERLKGYAEYEALVEMRKNFRGGSHTMALIVPYRNRTEQLETFSRVMNTYFDGIDMKWKMIVVEQGPRHPFNKAKLSNIGYDLSKGWADYFCFHDVDHLPAQPYIDYSYPEHNPRHLSMHFQSLGWKLAYPTIFGGVTVINAAQFQKINGHSNLFWGWGGEDDEVGERVRLGGMKIDRPEHACFFSLSYGHNRESKDEDNYQNNKKLLNKVKYRWQSDGLNTLNYTLVRTEQHPLYIKHIVDVKPREPG